MNIAELNKATNLKIQIKAGTKINYKYPPNSKPKT